jgi:hypothetical protein
VEQEQLFNSNQATYLEALKKEELIEKYLFIQNQYKKALLEISQLRKQGLTEEQIELLTNEHYMMLKQEMFGRSSERLKATELLADTSAQSTATNAQKSPRVQVKKPSERYPNLPIKDVVVKFEKIPDCNICGKQMLKSSMVEVSEQLTVIPKKYEILRIMKEKARCSCQSCIVTAESEPRIVPGSSYR